MVSLSIIKRLSLELGTLEERHKPARPWSTLSIERGMISDEAAVLERHYSLYPDDQHPNVIFLTIYPTLIEDIDGEDTKRNIAWRQVAREEATKHPPAELARLWGARAIAHELKAGGGVRDPIVAARGVGEVVTRYGFPEAEALELMRAAGIDGDEVSSAYERGKIAGAVRGGNEVERGLRMRAVPKHRGSSK